MLSHVSPPPDPTWEWSWSRGAILGLLAATDVSWQVLVDLPWRRLVDAVEFLSESAAGSALVTTLGMLSGTLRTTGLVLQWVFAGYLVYAIAHRMYLGSASEVTGSTRFRGVTATVTLLLALLLSTGYGVGDTGDPALVTGATAGMAVGLVLYSGYFRRYVGWNWMTPRERVALLNDFLPLPEYDRQQLIDGMALPGPRGRFADLVWKAALVLWCLIPAVLLGFFLNFAIALFPLLELSVLAGFLTNRLVDPERIGFSPDRLASAESRLFQTVSYAGRGVKGFSTMLLVLLGLAQSVLLFGIVVALWAEDFWFWLRLFAPPEPFALRPTTGLVLWNQTGTYGCIALASAFQIWFWYRILGRAPAFLDHWEREQRLHLAYSEGARPDRRSEAVDPGSPDGADDGSDKATPTPPTRPVGYLVPSVITFIAAFAFIISKPYPIHSPFASPEHLTFAVVWPLLVAAIGWCVYETFRRESQPIHREKLAIPGSLLVQSLGIHGPIVAVALLSFGPDTSGGSWLSGGGFLLLVVVAVLWTFFVDDVRAVARESDGFWEYANSLYVASFGAAAVFLATLQSGFGRLAILVLGGICFAGSIAEVIAIRLYP